MATFGEYLESKLEQALKATVVPALNNLGGGGGGGGPSESAMEQASKAGADKMIADMSIGHAGGVLGFLEGLPLLGVVFSAFSDPLRALFGQAGTFIESIALGYGLGAVTGEAIGPLGASLTYSAHRAAGDGRIDPATAGKMWAKRIMTEEQALHEAADLGFANSTNPGDPLASTGRISQFYEDAIEHPDAGTLLELLRRGVIDLPVFIAEMQRHGYTDGTINEIAQLAVVLLSPADLALAHLRGFIDLQTAYDYGKRLGVSNGDMDTLIANTGEPPGLEEMMSMWRRGIIDQPRFERGVRQSRVRDEWITYLEDAIHVPMSIADAVRAVVEKYIDQSEGQTIAEQNGLKPEHFPILVEAWGRPLSPGEMAHLYWRGLATQAQYEQAIRESDIKDKYVTQAFELARTLIPVRQVVTALQHGVIPHDEAVSQLMMQGYTQHDAEIELQLGLAEHHAALKELSKSDIQALYTDKLITKAEARSKLEFLGYSPAVSDWILELADARHTAGLARTLQAQVKSLYQKRELSREQAIDKLTAGGFAAENAHALVDEWDLVHKTPTRTLSEAQIVKAATDGIIGVVHAAVMLVGIGYSEQDATILLQEKGLVAYDDKLGPGFKPIAAGELFSGVG